MILVANDLLILVADFIGVFVVSWSDLASERKGKMRLVRLHHQVLTENNPNQSIPRPGNR